MTDHADVGVPRGTPGEVVQRVAQGMREPRFDPTLNIVVDSGGRGQPPHRIAAIGDSLLQGFQSGAILNTDLSVPAIIAHELGWLDHYRYPRYGGRVGGLPLNIELMLRRLEERFGPETSLWELPFAAFQIRGFMDEVEDYWERGLGATVPAVSAYNHNLAMFGWGFHDALERTAELAEQAIQAPSNGWLRLQIENANDRAALRVLPHWTPVTRQMTVLDAAQALGDDHDDGTDCGIETLVVFLGGNHALPTITELDVRWTEAAAPGRRGGTIWNPASFRAVLSNAVAKVKRVRARHVIWCTVPHVTIAPLARGFSKDKVARGSRYFPHYTRPWVKDDQFDPERDRAITDQEARAIDGAIDAYNDAIERVVEDARSGIGGPVRDWYLLDTAGLLDRLAARRFIEDEEARPDWWTEYELPAALKARKTKVTSRFLTADGKGGRGGGGLFSLDGVHPTTVGYGILAQELIAIMVQAGVEFRYPSGTVRSNPQVDFDRLLQRDSLVTSPPQNLQSSLDILGWADDKLGWVARSLGFQVG